MAESVTSWSDMEIGDEGSVGNSVGMAVTHRSFITKVAGFVSIPQLTGLQAFLQSKYYWSPVFHG